MAKPATHIFREGRQFEVDAKKAVTDQLTVDDDGTIRLDTSDGNGVFVPDDQKFFLGSDPTADLAIRYDSTADAIIFSDEGDSTDIIRFETNADANPNGRITLFQQNGSEGFIEASGGLLIIDSDDLNATQFSGRVEFTGNIKAESNDMEINTQGDGSDSISIRDNANSQDLAVFTDGSAVDLGAGNVDVQLNASGGSVTVTGSNETDNGMNLDPETDAEDAFLTVDIGTNSYQIPLYDASGSA